MRKLFGTDGVRGVAGVDLTVDLARDLGAAVVAWSGAGSRVVIGRDTRESGVALEDALVEGVVAAGGKALRAGVLPTPGVAVLTRLERAELPGCVISASHNPYQDNGIKFLSGDGRKLDDGSETAVEAVVGSAGHVAGGDDSVLRDSAARYLDWLVTTYGAGAPPWPVVLDCANGAAHVVAPAIFSMVGTVVASIGTHPDGRNINAGVGSTHLEAVAAAVAGSGAACGLAFDGDADRCLAVDPAGRAVSGDAIIAAIALARGVKRVVVTSMTNLSFHRVMEEHGIEVDVTDVGDRYVLAGMLATGATLGGEQSGHVVDLQHHTTGDGVATALMLLAALDRLGMSMADLVDLVVPFPQRLVAIPADRTALAASRPIWDEVEAAEARLGRDGRIVVRASGTEAVVRVMVEAADAAVCDDLCNHLVKIVQTEIGVG